MKQYVIYTDGSFSSDDGLAHGGVVYSDYIGNVHNMIHVFSNHPDFCSMRNVGGEILAAWAAIYSITESVKANGWQDESINIKIVYDYEGVGKWLRGEWQCKKNATRWYKDAVWKCLKSLPTCTLTYQWVHGHDGEELNELADRVASYDTLWCERNGVEIIDLKPYLDQYYK